MTETFSQRVREPALQEAPEAVAAPSTTEHESMRSPGSVPSGCGHVPALQDLHPAQRREAVLALQCTHGNAAVGQMLQRDKTDSGGPPAPTTLSMRDGSEGPADGAARPAQLTFRPLSSDEALKALTHIPQKPDWLEEALRPRPGHESAVDFYIVYENDGTGIVPNFGSGSDQGRTAALYIYANFNKQGIGLSRIGLTGIEMTTPRGTLPEGASKGPESTYETPQGPYGGVAAIDVGITVARSGSSKLDFIVAAGIDSLELGEAVQDTIHEQLSNSPVFPWPSGTKPLLEGGIQFNKTINDLTQENFAGLAYTGRLEIDAGVITGTRRTEATAGARFVIRTAKVHTPAGAISVEFSPFGAFARGFVRYNDGREAVLPGVEGGVNASLMLNIGRLGVGLRGEGMVSSDPAFQTGLGAGAHPAALKASPFVGEGHGMPAGAHGTGQLILKFEL